MQNLYNAMLDMNTNPHSNKKTRPMYGLCLRSSSYVQTFLCRESKVN